MNFDIRPTDAPPGSPEKIEVIKRRLEADVSLWHPDDRRDFDGLTGAVAPREEEELSPYRFAAKKREPPSRPPTL